MSKKLKTPILKETGIGAKKRTREDAAMVARAVRERWPIPTAKRGEVVKRVLGVVADKKGDDANALRAAQVLVSMDSLNRQDEEKANENFRLDSGKLTGRIAVEPMVLERPV